MLVRCPTVLQADVSLPLDVRSKVEVERDVDLVSAIYVYPADELVDDHLLHRDTPLLSTFRKQQLGIDELNKFIDKMKDEDQTRASGNLLNNTQLAWLAAAQIARDKGYECAALMVEFSV